jgi:hypothetical protein
VNIDWKYIFSLPYITARETKLQSLQYQILNRYIPCKQFLKICKKEENEECQHCGITEDLEHYFCKCKLLKPFWNCFNHWFSNISEARIELHSPDIILGIEIVNNEDLLHSLNFCILFAKNVINQSKKEKQPLHFNIFKDLLKDRLLSEKCILETQRKEQVFTKLWQKLYDSVT